MRVPPVPPIPLHRVLGLTDEELVAIEAKLRRAPNDLELAMFSVMWSEHCSYKSSRPLLATLPTGGDDVVAGPGENAVHVSDTSRRSRTDSSGRLQISPKTWSLVRSRNPPSSVRDGGALFMT